MVRPTKSPLTDSLPTFVISASCLAQLANIYLLHVLGERLIERIARQNLLRVLGGLASRIQPIGRLVWKSMED